jgi:hypothetical protein
VVAMGSRETGRTQWHRARRNRDDYGIIEVRRAMVVATRCVVRATGPLRCKGSGCHGFLVAVLAWMLRQHGTASVRSNSRADGVLLRLLLSHSYRRSYFDGAEGAWRTRWADAPSRRDDEDDGAAEEAARRRCPTLSSPAGKRRAALTLTMLKSTLIMVIA